jgi:hypothetical protein
MRDGLPHLIAPPPYFHLVYVIGYACILVCVMTDTGRDGDLRVVGRGGVIGGNNGTLQLFFRDTWGSVSTYGWTYHNARAACRQMGWATGAAVQSSGTVYGSSAVGPVWPTGFYCGWEENRLYDCPKWSSIYDNWVGIQADDSRAFNDTAGVVCRNGASVGRLAMNVGTSQRKIFVHSD